MLVILAVSMVALLWVLTIVDIVRQHYPGATTAGWLLLVTILPVVGSIIYGFARKPTGRDAEQQHLAVSDRRRSAAARPFDGTGFGP